MALQVMKSDNKGITTNYHRIVKVEVREKVVVTLADYVSADYREKEKQYQEVSLQSEVLKAQLSVEMAKEIPDTALIVQLSDQINALVYPIGGANCVVSETIEVLLDIDRTTLSFSSIYGALKNLSEYSTAVDA